MLIWCQLMYTSCYTKMMIVQFLHQATKLQWKPTPLKRSRSLDLVICLYYTQTQKCLQEVIFQVTSHEGSVIISCASSLELGLIQPQRGLDVVPEKGSIIYNKADLPVKQKNKKKSRDKQSHTVSRVEEKEVQCKNKKVKTNSKQQQCQAPVFNKKNVKLKKSVDMQPVKPQKGMQLKKPVAKDKNRQVIMCNKKQVPLSKDNSCKSGIPEFIGNQYILTRTVKKLRSQGSPEVIHSQWPRKLMCSYSNQ